MRPLKMWRPRRPVIVAPQLPERRSFLKRLLAFTAGGAALAAVKPREARADADQWIGEIALVPYTFPPKGWAFCNGQLLPINQNIALFSLLGTTFGGDGITTFALPDLRGRAPIHFGQGPGLSNYVLGQTGGAENITLLAAQMPSHTHALNVSNLNGTSDTPGPAVIPAKNASGVPTYSSAAANSTLAAAAAGTAGSSQPHENRPPFLTMSYVIALVGIFPSQN
jgi:microcystin-dependent protein